MYKTLKKIPVSIQEKDKEESKDESHKNITEGLEISENISDRQKRITKKPSRFNDMILYYIYD